MVKVSVKTKDLRNAIKVTSYAIMGRNRVTNPFFFCYCLRVSRDGFLEVLTNHIDEFLVSSRLECEVIDFDVDKKEKSDVEEFFVYNYKIKNLINKMDSDEVVLTFHHSQMSISNEKSTYMIPLEDVEKSYAFAHVYEKTSVEKRVILEVPDFKKWIANTLFSVDKDWYRPIMNGILASFKKDCVSFAASDGRILSYIDVKSVKTDFDCDFVIRREVADILNKSLPKVGFVDIKFFFDTAIIKVENEEGFLFEIHAKTIEGRYPNYKAVIPTNKTFEIKAGRNELISALDRLALFSNPAHKLVKFSISGNTVSMSANDSDYSVSGSESIDLIENDFKEGTFTIGFMHENMRKILKHIKTQNVVMRIESNNRGVVVCDDKDCDDKITYVIMPMMVAE